MKKFWVGLKLVPKAATTSDSKGDLEVLDSDSKIYYHNGTVNQPLLTEAGTATITAKTIVVSNNTITTAAAGNLSATELNAALAELDSDITASSGSASAALSAHINNATDAHDASAISVIPSGNLTSIEVQAALVELQLDIDGKTSSTLTNANILVGNASNVATIVPVSGDVTITNTGDIQIAAGAIVNADINASAAIDASKIADGSVSSAEFQFINSLTSNAQTQLDAKVSSSSTSVDNEVVRFDGTTGKIIQGGSPAILSDAGILTGLTGLTSSGTIESTATLLASANWVEGQSTDAATTGANASVSSPATPVVRLTNASLTSIDLLASPITGRVITVINATGNPITINNDTGATAANRILTGTKASLTLADEASIILKYDGTEARWMVVGGTGGASTALLSTSYTVPNLTAWASYVPTFTGFGTPSAVAFKFRQVGNNYEVMGTFTPSAVSAVLASLTLPNSSSINSDLIGVSNSSANPGQIVGEYGQDWTSAGVVGRIVTATATSTSLVYFGNQMVTNAPNLTPTNASAIFGASRVISVEFTIPITGLSATSVNTIPLTQSGLIQSADSMLRLDTSNGYGSTNTTIRRFTNITQNLGSDVTYVDSATLGASFTIVTSGTYSFSYADNFSSAANFGLSKNSNQLTTGINTITTEHRLIKASASAVNLSSQVAWTGYLNAGDVIRPHADTTTSGASTAAAQITITKQGSLSQVSINPNSKITIPTSELRFEGASTRGTGANTAIVRFDTQAIIRGDAFSVVSDATVGTVITMLKAGKLDVGTNIYGTATSRQLSISRNQVTRTGVPSASESLAAEYTTGTNDILSASWSGSVVIGDIIRVASPTVIVADISNVLNLYFQEQDISVSVSNTLPQFSESDSSVRVDTANGYGSTGTKIRRFSNTRDNIGVDVEYVDSATNGASFTAKSDGLYNISYTDNFVSASDMGISKNASSLVTNFNALSASERVAYGTTTANTVNDNACTQVYLVAGDTIRPHAQGVASGTAAQSIFTMSKVGKPNVTGVNVTPFVNVPQPTTSYLRYEGASSRGAVATAIVKLTTRVRYVGDSFSITDTANDGTFITMLRAGIVYFSSSLSLTTANSQIYLSKNQAVLTATPTASETLSSSQAYAATAICTVAASTSVEVGDTLRVSTSGAVTSDGENNFNISFTGSADQILTAPETFSTDTAPLAYAGSAAYTLATLANAPVGTFITYTYAASTNTRTQTTTAPTQTTADMNTNGMLIYTRAYNVLSSAAQPVAFAIQIGKGLKGKSLDLYKSAGKVTAGNLDFSVISSAIEIGIFNKGYNEVTGVLVVDAGHKGNSSTTASNFQFTDVSAQTSGYLVINASKNPALVGIGVGRVYSESAGNAAEVMTVNVTNIPFINISDTHGSWNGSQYTIPETGVYSFSGCIAASAAGARAISIYVNSTLSYLLSGNESASTHPFSINRRLNKGDIVSLRTGQAMTLASSTTSHHLEIVKVSN